MSSVGTLDSTYSIALTSEEEKIIKKFLETSVDDEYRNKADRFVKVIDQSIQRLAQEIIKEIKKKVKDQRANNELCFKHIFSRRLYLDDNSVGLIKVIFQSRYEFSVYAIECSSLILTDPSSKHSLCPHIFTHSESLNSWHIKVSWCPDNSFIYSNSMTSMSQRYFYQPQKELEKLWKAALDQKETDMVFIVQGKHLFAHRFILVVQSNYFSARFNSHMKDSKENSITIEDCSYEIFQLFLQFCYMGNLELNDASTVEPYIALLKLSCRYQVEGLKNWAIDKIKMHLQEQAKTEGLDVTIRKHLAVLFSLGSDYYIFDFLDLCFEHIEACKNTEELKSLIKMTNESCKQILKVLKDRSYPKTNAWIIEMLYDNL